MTRRTSKEAFDEIKASGLLSRLRFSVYEAIWLFGPGTSAEIILAARDARKAGGLPVRDADQLTQSRARFTELRERGVIHELPARPCGITGHKAIVWEVSAALPHKPAKRLSPAERERATWSDLWHCYEKSYERHGPMHRDTRAAWHALCERSRGV